MRRSAWVGTNIAVVVGLGALVAAAFVGVSLANRASTEADAGPGEILLANDSFAIARSYVVVLKPGKVTAGQVTPTASSLASRFSGTIGFTFATAARGFSVTMDPEQAKKLARDPSVAFVQQNRTIKADENQNNPPSWGLDRIDQRALPADKTYNVTGAGSGVTAYIVDSGIRISHKDFGGRASHGFDFVDNDADATDCNGHGTHVAGTVGGTTYGVAKAAKLVGVRVLNCEGEGTTASVIAGINWVTEHAVKPAVANMSLGGGVDPALDEALSGSIAAGVTFAVAAGNDNTDACQESPAHLPAALTVGATTQTDQRASFSNFGKCVDLFAPGKDIVSAGIADDTESKTFNGTSMAAPHVAGAAALILGKNPRLDPKQVSDQLFRNASTNRVTGPGAGSPNRLLYTGEQPDTGAPCGSEPVGSGKPSGSTSGRPSQPGQPGSGQPGGIGGTLPGNTVPAVPNPGGGKLPPGTTASPAPPTPSCR